MIDGFPVWNSEPDQPTMMSWAAAPEREEVSELSTEIGYIDDRSSSYYRRMDGAGAVWVVFSQETICFTELILILWMNMIVKMMMMMIITFK